MLKSAAVGVDSFFVEIDLDYSVLLALSVNPRTSLFVGAKVLVEKRFWMVLKSFRLILERSGIGSVDLFCELVAKLDFIVWNYYSGVIFACGFDVLMDVGSGKPVANKF